MSKIKKAKTTQVNYFTSIVMFFQEVKAELKKAVWPTREQVIKLTTIVIVISLLIGFVLGVLDNGFFGLFSVLRNWVKTLIL